jgi:hypothetical protein
MERIPSVKTLRSVFGERARDARRILEMTRSELEQHPVGAERVRECYHAPTTLDIRMTVLNSIAETHGVEGFQLRGEWLSYLNAGDTYTATLLYWRGSYRVGDWGSIVEREDR